MYSQLFRSVTLTLVLSVALFSAVSASESALPAPTADAVCSVVSVACGGGTRECRALLTAFPDSLEAHPAVFALLTAMIAAAVLAAAMGANGASLAFPAYQRIPSGFFLTPPPLLARGLAALRN